MFCSRFAFKLLFLFRFFPTREWLISQGNHSTMNNITMRDWVETFLVSYSIIVIPNVSHNWIIFSRSQRSLPTKVVFERILTKAFCQYIYDLMLKKKLGNFNDWVNSYFQSLICLWRQEHILASIFSKVSLALLNRI